MADNENMTVHEAILTCIALLDMVLDALMDDEDDAATAEEKN